MFPHAKGLKTTFVAGFLKQKGSMLHGAPFGFRLAPISMCSASMLRDADRFRSEWLTNQHRDTGASIIGHPGLHQMVAIAENESIARVKLNMLKVGC
jgi:hypothetical protein